MSNRGREEERASEGVKGGGRVGGERERGERATERDRERDVKCCLNVAFLLLSLASRSAAAGRPVSASTPRENNYPGGKE